MSASEHRLYHRLQLAAHRLQKTADRDLLAAAGVTTAQAAVLGLVAARGPVSQNHIAAELGINESAMTAMVARLRKLDLLDRTRAPQDARAWHLTVNPNGRAVLARVRPAFQAINARIDETLSAEQQAVLADTLERLARRFGTD